MNAETMFKEYWKMKQEEVVLEFQMKNFKGVSYDDVIESMCFSHHCGERVQDSKVSDKTGNTAVIYRKVAERIDDEWFDSLIWQYEYNQNEIDFFEYAVTQLSGRLPEFIQDLVIEHLSWEELMAKYCVGHSMVAKYRKKALGELNVLYQIRDKHVENYLLS